MRHLLNTAVGALGASALGAVAARYGVAPSWIAAGVSVIGAGVAYGTHKESTRSIASGAASAGGSQLLLLALQKHEEANQAQDATRVAQQTPAPPRSTSDAAPARLKNASLDALPPGSLDAAFERARAELAVGHGGGCGMSWAT